MAKKKIFISSVQKEFEAERKILYDYIYADPLLGRFFEPFIFEALPAIDQRVDNVYLREVENSTIYLGLFGKEYGFENSDGISPTELEFNHATHQHLTRLIFISSHPNNERHPKELALIEKAQEVVVRRKIAGTDDLKASVYAALVRYLVEKEIIRTGPFDASVNEKADLNDIDTEKIKWFVRLARVKRGFALQETDSVEKILIHLNLFENNKPVNAALLLFGKQPQRFFISSEVRCVVFRGTKMEKPIPSYKVFKGTAFELVDQTVEYILSKLDYSVGTRETDVQAPGAYEIPKDVIAEAVVNAIAHRDYTNNGSVQVMLFRDRLEIWNPGSLPLGWTVEKLKQLHSSVPANPLMAEPLYLTAYIERLGTGTSDMVSKSKAAGLKEPQFIQAEEFRTVLYRPSYLQITEQVPDKHRTSTDQVTPHDTPQVTPHDTPQVEQLIKIMNGEINRDELQDLLGLKDREHFRKSYIIAALSQGFIEMTIPEKPKSKNQKYRLTEKGLAFQKILKKK